MILETMTSSGPVRGVALENSVVYRGIPYARARRFMAPEAAKPWKAVRICDHFGAIAMQEQVKPGMPFSDFFIKEFYPHPMPMGEDCLFLNVWTPAALPGEKLPVMFWIHGGGLSTGYGHEMEFDGEAIAKRKVILVTINYRVGFFGCFAPREAVELNTTNKAGNNAVLDQIAALLWVQNNIEAFGGNKENVTVFGQSAGGGAVVSLLASPLARGLFCRAIIQSGLGGISTPQRQKTLEDGFEWADAFMKASGKCYDELEQMPADELLTLASEITQKLPVMPQLVVDHYVFDEPPIERLLKGIEGISLMAGSVNGDGDLKMPGAVYHGPESARAYFNELCIGVSQMQGAKDNPPYLYHFTAKIPGHDIYSFVADEVAFHSSELWYVFGTLGRCWRPFDRRHYRLSDMMIDYWTNFAKKGNPNSAGLPEWPAFHKDHGSKMLFLSETSIENKSPIDDEVWEGIAKVFE